MNFDKSKVYTALNADELKPGSSIIVADTIATLRLRVVENYTPDILSVVDGPNISNRFVTNAGVNWNLAYLVSEPKTSSRFKKVNLNEHIKVKLTPEGEKIHKAYYHGEKYANIPTELLPSLIPDKDGYVEYQLWDFMLIFGQHFHMGENAPCDLNCFIEVRE